ncbi:hypothetical protein [Paraglaciecola sp.]|uniref:hypothetical protein n=1 Tax=Paraglaciecola sp. TaxID=1920173 RepID=UPI003EF796A4
MNLRTLLISAGACSILAGITHLGIMVGGPDWYRFFGAGEQMAKMAEAGSYQPAIITTGIALVLFIWGLFALSAVGVVRKLPFLKTVLVLISVIYLVRAMAGLTLSFVSEHPAITQNSLTFWLISSTICFVIGILHLFGTIQLFKQKS